MNKNIQLSELTIRDLISAIFRQKYVIIIVFPVIMLSVYIGSLFHTPKYEASVKMHIKGQSQIASETYQGIGAFRIHITQMEIVKSIPVLRRAVKALKLDKRPLDYEKNFCHPLKKQLIDFRLRKIKSEIQMLTPEKLKEYQIKRAIENLKENLATYLIPNTDLFIIIIQDYSPEGAVAIANVVSRSYTIFDLQQQLAELTQRYGERHPSVQQLRDNIFDMSEKLSGEKLSDIEAIGTASVKVIEQASSTNEPIGRPKRLILLIAFLVSCIVGIAFALTIDFFNHTFKSPQDIVKTLGLPLLGSIPKRKYRDDSLINLEKYNPTKTEIRYSQFFEDLADQLNIYMKVDKLKTILVTSVDSKGGISTICSNLGICLAQCLDQKTLIIDTNFRNPDLYKKFKLNKGPGLANILEEGKLIEYHNIIKSENKSLNNPLPLVNNSNNIKNNKPDLNLKNQTYKMINHLNSKLGILQTGNTSISPLILLNDKKLDKIFKLLKVEYEAIIIDCTNLKESKDAGILSSHVDGVVIVINEGIERRQVVINAISYLKQKKANIVGIILNRRKFIIPKIIYDLL